jgi:hypothetical protein
MGTGEIRTIELENFTMEYNTRYKDDELDIFRRGKDIIESCQTFDQLDSANKVVDLIGKTYIGVKNALLYFSEDKRAQIRQEQESIDKMFDHGEAINDPELDK